MWAKNTIIRVELFFCVFVRNTRLGVLCQNKILNLDTGHFYKKTWVGSTIFVIYIDTEVRGNTSWIATARLIARLRKKCRDRQVSK